MVRFDILTLFPSLIDSYTGISIIGRARGRNRFAVGAHDIRAFTIDKHHVVDDRPYGGGPGMVLKSDVLARSLLGILKVPRSIQTLAQFRRWKRKKKIRVVVLSAKGSTFTQARARVFAKRYQRIVFVCGRYEGIDERFLKLVDEEISIGEYVVTGGELPALVVLDAIVRLIPGVLGKDASSVDESHSRTGYLEYPQYTRPESVNILNKHYWVPKVLLSGDHKRILAWRKRSSRALDSSQKALYNN